MTDRPYLKAQLRGLLQDVDFQISIVAAEAKKLGIAAAQLQTPDGALVLPPLLLAKSNILLGLSNLET